MEAFYRTHQYLVEHVQSPVRRLLMDEIDWTCRLIGIKGSRGVGKTTFLLQYAKEKFGKDNPKCLYINFNNFFFTTHTLLDFVEMFYRNGGRTLLIDQTFKYENWAQELRQCYDRFSELHIVFSGSTVMRLTEGNEYIKDIVAMYNLRGFSFREFVYLQSGKEFAAYSIEQIIENHENITREICTEINPLAFFQMYLHHGYYPFYLEKRNFSENLLKTMNMMLEVDILLIKQIELKYLSKIRKLLYLLMQNSTVAPNVSQLSNEISTSRATIMNYIKYLQDARLLNLLYRTGDAFPKKPSQIYVHNPNLLHIISPSEVNRQTERKTFLYNALHVKHKINTGGQRFDFLIDGKYQFKCGHQPAHPHLNSKIIYAADIKTGTKNEIPLWLFGFLY
ncbi:MAG: AAA family ATPase [Paludibacter sp.]|jgi:predicted AAA+ superfamily ATPase|nr:AAA family ATPase [Paludibacter sp.]